MVIQPPPKDNLKLVFKPVLPISKWLIDYLLAPHPRANPEMNVRPLRYFLADSNEGQDSGLFILIIQSVPGQYDRK
jgi:hypothetical protein